MALLVLDITVLSCLLFVWSLKHNFYDPTIPLHSLFFLFFMMVFNNHKKENYHHLKHLRTLKILIKDF